MQKSWERVIYLVVDEKSPAGPLQETEDKEDWEEGESDEEVVTPVFCDVHVKGGELGNREELVIRVWRWSRVVQQELGTDFLTSGKDNLGFL